jgi:pimeloyl-ACP methyl ester carboxylesterase
MTKIESLRLNGVECVYAERGKGCAALFVHGSVVDCRIWDEHAEIIGSHYRVLAPSQRYFGVSPWPDEGRNYSVLTHATDLAALVRALGLPPVTLIGWSYGGAVCLAMSCANPDLVGRLFLYEPSLATFVTDPSAAQRASDDRLEMFHASKLAVGQGDLDEAVEQFIDDVNGRAGTFRALPDKVQQMMRENARTLPLMFGAPSPPQITCADLGRLSMPATVARGSDSRAYFRIAVEGAARCMAAARTTTVPNARHLWPIEDPRGFSQVVLDWLEAG